MVIVVQTQFRTEFLARIHALQVELSAAGYLIDTSGPCGPRREGFAALVVARRAVNPPDAASTGGSDFPLRPAAALLQAH